MKIPTGLVPDAALVAVSAASRYPDGHRHKQWRSGKKSRRWSATPTAAVIKRRDAMQDLGGSMKKSPAT